MRRSDEPIKITAGQRHAELGQRELTVLHRQLEREWQRLLSAYRRDVAAERAVPFGEAEDMVDHLVKEECREELSALADGEREQLRQVEEALERIADGSYGFCLETGAPIPLARLEAIPWARYSIEVQELAEKGLLDDDHA